LSVVVATPEPPAGVVQTIVPVGEMDVANEPPPQLEPAKAVSVPVEVNSPNAFVVEAKFTVPDAVMPAPNFCKSVHKVEEPAATKPAPFANWLVVAFLIGVTGMLALDDDTRVALYVAPFWFALLGLGYSRCKSTPVQQSA